MKSINFSKNSWALLITIFIIGLGYSYYFFIYVKNNEKTYYEKAHRVLAQLGKNISGINENYKGQLKFYQPKPIQVNDPKVSAKKIKHTSKKIKNEAQEERISIINKKAYYEASLDVISNKYSKRKNAATYSKILKDSIEVLNELLKGFKEEEENVSLETSSYTKRFIKKYNLQESDSLSYLIGDPEYVFYTADSSTNKFYFKASLDEFVKSLNKQYFFSEYLILRGSPKKIAYQSFVNKVSLSQLDTLYKNKIGHNPGQSLTINLNDIDYKIFLNQFKFSDDEYWTLIGCIKNDQFVSKTRNVDSWLLLYSGLLIVIILVSMPVLKLALMSHIERLHTSNVFFTGISIVIGSPLMILSFLIIYNYFSHDLNRVDTKLDTLSKDISTRFINEIEDAYNQLKYYEVSLRFYTKKAKEIEVKNEIVPNILEDSVLKHSYYPYYNEAFWLDSLGVQRLAFTPFKEANPLSDLKEREYFLKALNNDFWRLPKSGEPFFLQSITSWTTGLPEIAISKPSLINKWPVSAISSNFNSIMNVVLPLGYQFALVDEKGDVMIHSEIVKSNQENFLEETENDQFLTSALLSQASIKLTTKYQEQDIRLLTFPINNIPLTLIVYHNLELSKTKLSQIWFFALLLILLSFSSCLVILLFIYWSNFKTTLMEFKLFFMQWMRPSFSQINVYHRLIVANSLVIILMMILNYSIDTERLFEFIPKAQVLISHFSYDSGSLSNVYRIAMLPMIILLMTYVNMNYKTVRKNLKRHLTGPILILALFNFFHFNLFGFSLFDYVFQILIILFFWPGLKLERAFPYLINLFQKAFDQLRINRSNNYASLKELKTSYSVMLMFWLLSTSIMPVYFYYKISFIQESKIWAKHELIDYARKKEAHYEIVETEIFNINHGRFIADKTENEEKTESKFTAGIYPVEIYDQFDGNFNQLKTVDPSKIDELLFYLRPAFTYNIIQNRGLVWPVAADSTFKWVQDTLKEEYVNLSYEYQYPSQLLNQPNHANASFLLDSINFFKEEDQTFFSFILHLLGSLALFIYLYFIIRFSTSKIYALYPNFNIQSQSQSHENLSQTIAHHNIILLGHSNSGRSTYVNKDLNGKLSFNFDMMKLNDPDQWNKLCSFTSSKKFEIAILDNFEYLYHDHEASHHKLRLIESLLLNKKKVIIITETDPQEIIDYYVSEISKTDDVISKKSFTRDLEVWRHIFSSFVKIFKPFNPIESAVELIDDADEENIELIRIMKSELCYGTYLPFLASTIKSKRDYFYENFNPETIILEIQHLAQPYYTALWNTLTTEERFVVYDLAKNDFVNVKNKSTILFLMKKGMIKNDKRLQLFNQSFRNFVLMANKDEALAMEKVVKEKGSWSKIRSILIIIILGVITLIGFAQPNFFQNINSIVLVLTGVVSFLPTLNHMISMKQNPTST
ncbi:MAG: hypothetical protein JXR07_07985 [Reichenbachiella sp.]